MRRIRAMVVDDSSAVRRLLVEILGSDPEVEVVGAASNGREALEALDRVWADIIILDVEMPEMSGPAVLAALGRRARRPKVIVFTSFGRRAAQATLEALALGASDFVAKPSQTGSADASREKIRSELLPRIHALCDPARSEQTPAEAPPAPPIAIAVAQAEPPAADSAPAAVSPAATFARRRSWEAAGRGAPQILAIGASTGGPAALTALLSALPADFPLPIVVAQHLPAAFTALFAERLASHTGLRVCEAKNGAPLEPGAVHIAPGDHHLEVSGLPGSASVRLHQGPRENSCRPAVDVLFRSLAATFGASTLAVVLTGMGQDGLLGARALHAVRASLIAQDEATSVVWGMPGKVANAGLGAQVLPLQAIAQEVLRQVGPRGRFDPRPFAAGS